MERRPSSRHGANARRQATSSRALIPTAPARNPPQRRIFSSNEQRINGANVEALEDTANRMHQSPAYLQDDASHRPFSNPRLRPLTTASRGGLDIQIVERQHGEPSQSNSDDEDPEDFLYNDDSDSRDDGGSSSDQILSQDEPSYSPFQDVIDSLWQLNNAPEKLQEGFDMMVKDMHILRKKLSRERRSSARLSRRVEALDREMKSLQAKEKEQGDFLCSEKAMSNSLREEIEKLRSEFRKGKQLFEKSQAKSSQELDRISQGLKEAKNNIQLKEEQLSQVQRELACLKQENESELSLRKAAVAESEVFKRNLFELRKRSNEEKRQLLASQDEKEENLTKLRDQNQTLGANVAALEETIEHQRESKEVVEADLLGVLSFLRSICDTVQQVYLAACAHEGRCLQEVIAFPSSECLKLDEECRDYEVFGQLFTALNESLSSESVLELASAYEEALLGFFKIIIFREFAHSEYVYFTEDVLEEVKSVQQQLRYHVQKERQRLRDRSTGLASDLLLQREHVSVVKAALECKDRELEEEMIKIGDRLMNFEATSTGVLAEVTACKKGLNSVKENLVNTKKWQGVEDFKTLLSKDLREKGRLCGEVERARASIKSLDLAASTSAKKQKKVEAALRGEIEGLTALVAQRDTELRHISIREAGLRKTKEELESSSRQAITDCEEQKKRIAALNHQNEKVTKEKDDALRQVAVGERANQKLSEKVAEILGDKQSLLEALVVQKNAYEDLQSLVAKRSKRSDAPRVLPQPLQTLMLDEPQKNAHNGEQCRNIIIGSNKSAPKAISLKQQGDKLRPSSATMHCSPLQTGDNVEADLCEVDLVPHRPKRRAPVQKTRKSPHQKRAKLSTAKRATAANDTPRHDPKSTASPRAASLVQDIKHRPSSTSAPTHDEDWDIDLTFGEVVE